MPLKRPVLFIVAIEVLPIDQLPPVAVFDNLMVSPWQTLSLPVIVATTGNGNTLNKKVAESCPQLLVTIYFRVVLPADKALTTPKDDIVATEGAVLLHTPPAVPEADNDMVPPTQVLSVPLIVPARGSGLIVIYALAVSDPQLLVAM